MHRNSNVEACNVAEERSQKQSNCSSHLCNAYRIIASTTRPSTCKCNALLPRSLSVAFNQLRRLKAFSRLVKTTSPCTVLMTHCFFFSQTPAHLFKIYIASLRISSVIVIKTLSTIFSSLFKIQLFLSSFSIQPPEKSKTLFLFQTVPDNRNLIFFFYLLSAVPDSQLQLFQLNLITTPASSVKA